MHSPRALLPLLLAAGCTYAPSNHDWRDQLVADGPCYRVDLWDGLDASSTAELHDTFACLNRTGVLAPMVGVDAAMDQPTRSGAPAGVELANVVNGLLSSEVDVFGLAGKLLPLVRGEDAALRPLVRVSAELLYGTSWDQLHAGQVMLSAGSSLDRGVVRPLLPALGHAAGELLDSDPEALALASAALRSDFTVDAAHTLRVLAATPAHADLVGDLPAHVGDAIARTRSPDNDRWEGASGDSLRDLAEALLVDTGFDGRLAVQHMVDPAEVMLDDAAFRRRLTAALTLLDDQALLPLVPSQILYLAQVDADGGQLSRGEDSALLTLLRLLHNADQPMRCSLDLRVTTLRVDLGNLSVTLLETLSQQDPRTVQGGVDLLGSVIGWPLSTTVLNAVADSRVCPVLDRQMVEDLDAIDRLNDPASGDLIISVLALLDAFYDPSDSRTPELVDLLGTIYVFDATRPLEELLRDIGNHAAVYDVLELVGLLLHPGSLDDGGYPEGHAPLDIDRLLDAAQAAVTADGGPSPLEELAPAVRVLLLQEGTWDAVQNFAALLQRSDAEVNDLPRLLDPLLAVDPELTTLDTLAPLTEDAALATAMLRVVEAPGVLEALGAAELSQEGPLPFYGRLVVSDTLDALLSWLDWSLSLLDLEP